MNLWTIMLVTALLAGIMGWVMTFFTSAVIYGCMLHDGDEINWGLEAAFIVATPFVWVFAVIEIMLVYGH